MNYCGLICEYNPFHSGHLYQLNEIKKLPHINAIICAMSGNFVQRAEPAIVNKSIRATIAINGGADAVIQIPAAYTVAGGENFSFSALNIFNKIKNLKYLAFGCETTNFELLKTLAKIRAEESKLFKKSIQDYLKEGSSYPKALTLATIKVAAHFGYIEEECAKILNRPNNILGIEYLKIIYCNNYDIEPIFISRIDNYNSKSLIERFTSATAIRAAVLNKNNEGIEKFLPYSPQLLVDNLVNYNLYDELLLFSLRKVGTNFIRQLADCAEGIENRLYKNTLKYTNINEVLDKTKTKRYTYARLKRIAIESLLEITKDCVDTIFPYGKLLGIKKTFKKNMSDFGKEIIVQYKDMSDITSEKLHNIISIDSVADNIYAQLSGVPAGNFFKDKLIEM